MDTSSKENKYFRAKERVNAVKKFYATLFSNLATIAFLAAVNYYVNEFRNPWVLWVVFFISVSLIIKAIKLFGYNMVFGANWEQQKIKKYMQDEDVKTRWK
jgi:hypothetical protein